MDSQDVRALDELTRLGEGRTAEIFAWGEGRALRLSREGTARASVLREMCVSRSVHEAGIPSPAVYPADTDDGLIEIDGRIGFAMDRIDGPSMLREATAKPWRLGRFARTCARLHLAMHERTAAELPSQRERLHRVIDRITETVGEAVAQRIRQAVDALPDGDVVCHGDFHPDNILMSVSGPIIIDWGPATSGNQAADVAWTVYLFRHGGTPPGGMSLWQRLVLDAFRRLFLLAYLRTYLKEASIHRRDIERWGPPIAALRLGDEIPEERDLLLRLIRRHFDPLSDD